MPGSLLVFDQEAYTGCLHDIEAVRHGLNTVQPPFKLMSCACPVSLIVYWGKATTSWQPVLLLPGSENCHRQLLSILGLSNLVHEQTQIAIALSA